VGEAGESVHRRKLVPLEWQLRLVPLAAHCANISSITGRVCA